LEATGTLKKSQFYKKIRKEIFLKEKKINILQRERKQEKRGRNSPPGI
jgi:hypothetical protein